MRRRYTKANQMAIQLRPRELQEKAKRFNPLSRRNHPAKDIVKRKKCDRREREKHRRDI